VTRPARLTFYPSELRPESTWPAIEPDRTLTVQATAPSVARELTPGPDGWPMISGPQCAASYLLITSALIRPRSDTWSPCSAAHVRIAARSILGPAALGVLAVLR